MQQCVYCDAHHKHATGELHFLPRVFNVEEMDAGERGTKNKSGYFQPLPNARDTRPPSGLKTEGVY
ncbi:hypothetical protein LINBF2_17520 [Limnohabitans sp. INBF002]|nr:hypothetical protein LINBF2_17520 [Limnohabitans sp. INBF002]